MYVHILATLSFVQLLLSQQFTNEFDTTIFRRGELRYNTYALSTTKCGFPDNSVLHYGALGPPYFSDALACGQCVTVWNRDNRNSVSVVIVDQCLGCGSDNLMVDQKSFAELGSLAIGMLKVTWKFEVCKNNTRRNKYVEYERNDYDDTDVIEDY